MADSIRIFQAKAVRGAIRLYRDTGLKVNSMYTPTNMLRTAGQIVGKTYKRGQLKQAEDDLSGWIARQEKELQHG